MSENSVMDGETETAERLLAKVRAFVAGLDEEERQLFAALIGPGVSLAHRQTNETDEVLGFESGWGRRQLPGHLAQVVRDQGVRVVGL